MIVPHTSYSECVPNYTAQVSLQALSGLPTDRFVNTFHFSGTGTLATDGDEIAARLNDFYLGATVGTGTICRYLANAIIGGTIKVYDMADAEPRIPNENPVGSLDTRASAVDLPREVALVLSLHGVPPITPRRRGRLFIGPLNTGALDTSGKPLGDFMNSLRRAQERMMAQDDNDLRWVIYSPTTGLFPFVTAGWVDEAWDTMRSRGEEAAARYVVPIPV